MSSILLSAKEEIISDSSKNLTGQILIVKNHFNKIFYDELNTLMDNTTESSFQSGI